MGNDKTSHDYYVVVRRKLKRIRLNMNRANSGPIGSSHMELEEELKSSARRARDCGGDGLWS